MKNKICVSKRSSIILVIVLFISGLFLVVTNVINTNKLTTNSRASAPKNKQAVIGGKIASSGDYPFFATIGFSCGGSLIDPYWILTVKHCVSDQYGNIKKPSDLLIMTDYVSYSQVLTNPRKHIFEVETVIQYEDKWSEVGKGENSTYYTKIGLLSPTWFKFDLNDIVLVKLKNRVDLPTISFPKSNWNINISRNKGVILGIGSIQQSASGSQFESDSNLRYGEVVLKKDNETLYDYKKEKDTTLNARFLMAFYDDTNSLGASGDSGGPVVVDDGKRRLLAGLMAVASLSANSVVDNRYVNVSYYSNWITQVTGVQPESGTWNGTLLPSLSSSTITPTKTLSPTPISSSGSKPYCPGENRFCSALDKCEDYVGGVYHENKNYQCYNSFEKCCEHE
jgi:hypothetical protein